MVDDGGGEDEVHGHGDEQREEVEEGEGVRETEARRPPVERVEIEQFRDPEQPDQIVEAIVHNEEEPEVERNERLTVPGAAAAAAEVLAVAGERALGGARGRETVEEAHYGVPKDREVENVPGRRDE